MSVTCGCSKNTGHFGRCTLIKLRGQDIIHVSVFADKETKLHFLTILSHSS